VQAVVPSHSEKALLDMFWGNQVQLGSFPEQVVVGVVAR
jgi:isochorismate hydrolase